MMFEDEVRDEAMRDLARYATDCLKEQGFALAGGTSLRLHGITDRPSEDIDLFVTSQKLGLVDGLTMDELNRKASEFRLYAQALAAYLKGKGYEAEIAGCAPFRIKLDVRKGGYLMKCDLAVQNRVKEPVVIDGIRVVDEYDSERGKFTALFKRAAHRDYYDAYRVAQKEGITFAEAFSLTRGADASRMGEVADLFGCMDFTRLKEEYGMTDDEIGEMHRFLSGWFAG